MNTTLAFILTIVVTNWTHIGDLRDNQGRMWVVDEGRMATNKVVDVVWSEEFKFTAEDLVKPEIVFFVGLLKTNRFILKSVDGPCIGDRRVLITNIWVTNIWATNIPCITNQDAEFRRKWMEDYWRNYRSNRIIYNSNIETTNKP